MLNKMIVLSMILVSSVVFAKDVERKTAANFTFSKRVNNVDLDKRADVKRDEAIAKLKVLLPQVADGSQKAELVFRLGELYWAKSRYNEMFAMQEWDAAQENWHKAGSKGEEPKLKKADTTLYRNEALKLYEKIIAEYADYPRNDEVLYNLGSSYYDYADKQKGVAYYWKLIKKFPNSDFAADAWLELGEHFFNANQLDNAIKAYSKAAETKKPRIYSYAIYKLAWCDYNAQKYDAALSKFSEVIAYAKKQQQNRADKDGIAERDRIQLLEEALRDMLKTYSHLDTINQAFDFYFKEVGSEKAYTYLQQLGQIYTSEGKPALAIKTYQELNVRFPNAATAPQNQTAIMQGYAALNNNNQVRLEVRRMIDLYSPDGAWAKHNANDKRVLENAFAAVESELAGLVVDQHRAAQTTKLVETYKLARDLYEEYLSKFSTSENAYKFRFYFAEILFELKDFARAADEYALVVKADAKGEFVKPAAYTTILALEKVLSGNTETLGQKIQNVKTGKDKGILQKLEKLDALKEGSAYIQEPLTENEQKLANACDVFVEVAPADPEVVKVKFKSARLYFIHYQFEEAAKRFHEIIEKWPHDELARLGAESIVESFNVRKDWLQLGKWARLFRSNTNLMTDKEFAVKIHEFVEGASFNEIHYLIEPKDDVKLTADRYFAFVKEFPQSKFTKVALFNSIVFYDKANVLEAAIVSSEKLLSEYKEEKGEALFLLASFYERLAEFAKAATLYEQFAETYPKAEQASDALFNAGLYRESLGDYSKAITDFKAYLNDGKPKKDAGEIAWRIGVIYEKQKDYKNMQTYFETLQTSLAKTDPAVALCAGHKVTQALVAQNKTKEALSGYTQILTAYEKLSTGKDKVCVQKALATASFYAVEEEYENYTAISLAGPEKEMAAKLMKKIKLIDSLQKRYLSVLTLGQGEYGLASLYRIGNVYQHLAKALFDSPCPKRLDEDQCAIYLSELQEQATPLEEKAIEAYKKALDKAFELSLYTPWLLKTQEALKTFEPDKFLDIHEIHFSETTRSVTQPEIMTTLVGGA